MSVFLRSGSEGQSAKNALENLHYDLSHSGRVCASLLRAAGVALDGWSGAESVSTLGTLPAEPFQVTISQNRALFSVRSAWH